MSLGDGMPLCESLMDELGEPDMPLEAGEPPDIVELEPLALSPPGLPELEPDPGTPLGVPPPSPAMSLNVGPLALAY